MRKSPDGYFHCSWRVYFNLFGSLAQYERSLARERIMAGLEAAKKRGKIGGRPRKIDEEKLNTITQLIKSGKTKAEICRSFEIPRSTDNSRIYSNKVV